MDILEQFKLVKQRRENEQQRNDAERIITVHRKQVSISKPAIAQLVIKFPSTVQAPDVIQFFNQHKNTYGIEAKVHKIIEMSEREFLIEVQGVVLMYRWMEYFIHSFVEEYGREGKGFNIRVKGEWESYRDF